MEFATRTIHAGQPSEPDTGSLVAPIFQTSTYEQERARRPSGLRLLAHEQPDARPARGGARRSRRRRARRRVRLRPRRRERGPAGVSQARRRDRHPARRLRRHLPPADQRLPAARLHRPQVDVADAGALGRRSAERTRLVWIESPTNPRLLVYDIAAHLRRRARRAARSSSSTTRSRRRCSSSRSSSAPTSSFTA